MHIVLNVDIVEPEAYSLQQRAFPTLVTGDDPVVDLLDLFRRESNAEGLNDVLVIPLAVETTVDGVIINAGPQRIIVVVDDCKVLGFVILEDYYPIIGKDFTVIGNKSNGSSPHL